MKVHETAEVAADSSVGQGTMLWHQAQVAKDVVIGESCVLGKGVYVGAGSRIGDRVKIQNYASIFGAEVHDEAFIGPYVCLIEDRAPRAVTASGQLKKQGDWTARPSLIRRGASLGAHVTILPGITIGQYAMVAAGSTVSKSVPDYTLVAGSPARPVGFVCACGAQLSAELTCGCGQRYAATDHGVVPL